MQTGGLFVDSVGRTMVCLSGLTLSKCWLWTYVPSAKLHCQNSVFWKDSIF